MRLSTSVVRLIITCAAFAFAAGISGNASAAQLLFRPTSGKFPYHLTGVGGTTVWETTGGSRIEIPEVHSLVLVTTATLFNAHFEFLRFALFGSSCHNDGAKESVLMSLLGHIGLADPGDVPAALLLEPAGFEFECGSAKVKLSGEVIGRIAAPAVNSSSELLRLAFKQSKGIQEFTTFLQGTQTLTNQFMVLTILGGEQAGQEGEIDLKALPGQGTFLLLTP